MSPCEFPTRLLSSEAGPTAPFLAARRASLTLGPPCGLVPSLGVFRLGSSLLRVVYNSTPSLLGAK